MIRTDSAYLADLVDQSFQLLERACRGYPVLRPVQDDLVALAQAGPPILVSTRIHYLHQPRLSEYEGLTRSSDDGLVLIELHKSRSRALPDEVLLLHELVHAAGGNELDSEVVEHVVCRMLNVPPLINTSDLEEFENSNYRGRWFTGTPKLTKVAVGYEEREYVKVMIDDLPRINLWIRL